MPNAAELKKLFAGAREAGLVEEQLRDLVEQVSGQRSTRQLSPDQTKRVLDTLVSLGARKGTPRKRSGRRLEPGVSKLITPGQRELIAHLREQIGADWLREEYFAGACQKRIRRSSPATAADAAKVIEMLKRRRDQGTSSTVG